MTPGDRIKATYQFKPVDHLVRCEFYIWEETIERWKNEGLPPDYATRNLFCYDPPGTATPGVFMGGAMKQALYPRYEERIVKDEGQTQIIQDISGRWLRVYQGERHDFMPEYLKHPVTGMKDWEEDVALRLDPGEPKRYENLEQKCKEAADKAQNQGMMVSQEIPGGYMFLRTLIGPQDLLYTFYDQPHLIDVVMQRWAELMDTGLARIQSHTAIDELMINEDICYNHGLLISPEMFQKVLLPYYQQVIIKARRRQAERLYVIVDSDGWTEPAVPLYLEAGMDGMLPWEVASGCDVVKIGRKWPSLIMSGGIDKRVLARGKEAIDDHLAYIIPTMVKRGGYIPTCDHSVPHDVSYHNYLHYRQRICEVDH